MTGSKQLPLPLPAREALGREDFFVSEANAMAVALVERWSEWPGAKMVICGPRGSGKTHLAHVWAKLSGARIVGADTLPEAEIPDLASGPVCVEDVPQIAGDRPAEEALFHLHNLVLAQGHSLLMTAEREPTLWPLVLPDLKSRIMGAQVARLGAPDDALLTALLAKQFADRQITPKPEVIPYLLPRMDRSFDAAQRIVERLDRMALDESRTLSRSLAARAFGPDNAPETLR